VLIVSQAEIAPHTADQPQSAGSKYHSELLGATIMVSKALGGKCERCWKYEESVGANLDHPDVCSRCAAVLGSRAAA
jgi:isoleucyl-tRNA synthetase